MALERSGYFNGSTEVPLIYDADALAAMFRALALNGVAALDDVNLKVTAEGSTMRTIVGYGYAIIKGYNYELRDDGSGAMTFTHSATVGADRIDRIVVQLDLTAPVCKLVKKAGTAAADPEPPALIRTSDLYEISLAQVRVRAGATELLDTDVTDERADEDVCGAALPEGVKLSLIWNRMAKPNASHTTPGMMAAADKVTLDELDAALTPTVTVEGETTVKTLGCNGYGLTGAEDYQTTGGLSLKAVKQSADELDAGKADLDGNSKVQPEQASSRIVSVSAAARTLALTDAGAMLLVSVESTITVPANTSVAFPTGTEIEITQYGSGAVTVAGADGVTVVSVDGSLITNGQYASVCLKKLDVNTWLLSGGLE